VLFEEAFAIRLVRMLRQVVDHHPVIVASKSAIGVTAAATWSARIDVGDVATRISPGEPLRGTAVLTNVGSKPWQANVAGGIGQVSLGLQVLDAGGRLVDRDFHRVPLPRSLAPGEQAAITFECRLAQPPGRWQIKFDLVAEGVTWFETAGSGTVVRDVVIDG
jgi:hypothetical protein